MIVARVFDDKGQLVAQFVGEKDKILSRSNMEIEDNFVVMLGTTQTMGLNVNEEEISYNEAMLAEFDSRIKNQYLN